MADPPACLQAASGFLINGEFIIGVRPATPAGTAGPAGVLDPAVAQAVQQRANEALPGPNPEQGQPRLRTTEAARYAQIQPAEPGLAQEMTTHIGQEWDPAAGHEHGLNAPPPAGPGGSRETTTAITGRTGAGEPGAGGARKTVIGPDGVVWSSSSFSENDCVNVAVVWMG